MTQNNIAHEVTFDTIELGEFITLEADGEQLRVVYRVPATGAVLCTHPAVVEATQRIVHRGVSVEYGYLGLSVYERGGLPHAPRVRGEGGQRRQHRRGVRAREGDARLSPLGR